LNFKVNFFVFLLVILGFWGPCGDSPSPLENKKQTSSQGEEDSRSGTALSHQKESNFSSAPFFSLISKEKISLPDLLDQEIALLSFEEDKNEKDKVEQIYFQYQISKEFFLFLCILKNREKADWKKPEEKNYPWTFEKIRALKLEENSIPAKMQQAILQYFSKPESSKQILQDVADTLERQKKNIGAKTFLAICYEQGIGRERDTQKSEVLKKEVSESFEKAGSTRFPFAHSLEYTLFFQEKFKYFFPPSLPYVWLDIRDLTLILVCRTENYLSSIDLNWNKEYSTEFLDLMKEVKKALEWACFCMSVKDSVLNEIVKNWMTKVFEVIKNCLKKEYLGGAEFSFEGECFLKLIKYYIQLEDHELMSQVEEFLKSFLGNQVVNFQKKITFILQHKVQFSERVKEWWKFLSGGEAYFQTRSKVESNFSQLWVAMHIIVSGKRALRIKEDPLVNQAEKWLISKNGRELWNKFFSDLEEEIKEEIENLTQLKAVRLHTGIIGALGILMISPVKENDDLIHRWVQFLRSPIFFKKIAYLLFTDFLDGIDYFLLVSLLIRVKNDLVHHLNAPWDQCIQDWMKSDKAKKVFNDLLLQNNDFFSMIDVYIYPGEEELKNIILAWLKEFINQGEKISDEAATKNNVLKVIHSLIDSKINWAFEIAQELVNELMEKYLVNIGLDSGFHSFDFKLVNLSFLLDEKCKNNQNQQLNSEKRKKYVSNLANNFSSFKLENICQWHDCYLELIQEKRVSQPFIQENGMFLGLLKSKIEDFFRNHQHNNSEAQDVALIISECIVGLGENNKFFYHHARNFFSCKECRSFLSLGCHEKNRNINRMTLFCSNTL